MADYTTNHEPLYNYTLESFSPDTCVSFVMFPTSVVYNGTNFPNVSRLSSLRNGILGIRDVINTHVRNITNSSLNMDASVFNSSLYTGPIVASKDWFHAIKRPTTNPNLSLLNGNNSYSVFDSSIFSTSGSTLSNITLKLGAGIGIDASGVCVNNWNTIQTVVNTNVVGYLRCSDGSIYYTPAVNATTITTAQGSDASMFYLVGVDASHETGDVSLFTTHNSVNSVYYRQGNLYQSSDAKLKDVQSNVDVDFDALKGIEKVYFNWKDDENKESNIGVIAQSVEKVYPELVSTKDGVKSVAYDKLAVIALAAIDKLNERVAALEDEVYRLRSMSMNIPVPLG